MVLKSEGGGDCVKTFVLDSGRLQMEPVKQSFGLQTLEIIHGVYARLDTGSYLNLHNPYPNLWHHIYTVRLYFCRRSKLFHWFPILMVIYPSNFSINREFTLQDNELCAIQMHIHFANIQFYLLTYWIKLNNMAQRFAAF